eukprot:2377870-Pyramimonas_sp.AAC.1
MATLFVSWAFLSAATANRYWRENHPDPDLSPDSFFGLGIYGPDRAMRAIRGMLKGRRARPAGVVGPEEEDAGRRICFEE